MKQEGAQPDSRKDYKLPICDVDTERRNFEGYQKKNWVTLEEWRQGDFAGSSDTDTETDSRVDNPHYKVKYTKINNKGGRPKMRSFKTSSPRTKDN